MSTSEAAPAEPIDALGVCPPGRYSDSLVEVVRENARGPVAVTDVIVRTAHFALGRAGRRIELRHALRPEHLDNDLAGLLVDELFAPGWLTGNDVFERVFTGVVRSTVSDPLLAWNTFYGNTLSRITEEWQAAAPTSVSTPASAPVPAASSGHSSIAELAPVYRRVLDLVGPGRVVDLGSCFGFLALLLAQRPRNEVTATDIVPGTIDLLRTVAGLRNVPLRTVVCDAAWVPLPDGCAETVTAVHLLEHLDVAEGATVLGQALRLATERVVIAVPFEDETNPTYGHVSLFDLARLAELGAESGYRYEVLEYHGGWLIIDKT